MKLVLLLVLICLGIGAAVLTRTLTIPVRKSDYKPEQGNHRAEEYAAKLSKMVKYDTTSYAFTDQRETFLGYHKILASLFPLVHERLEIIEIDGSLLFHYKGRSDRKPIVLMGHQDVVPAPEGWDRPPFSGEIANGKVYGRGSVDTKCSCMAFFQAAEELLAEEYLPEQDVWLSTSCTEEWGGPGCPALVEELQRRGVKPWLVCDEGGGIYTDPMMGIKGNFAMIGVAEKGRANVRFTAKGKGGHASTPQKNSPITRLAAFVCDVEKHCPFKSKMEPETRAMLEALAPAASFPIRLILENLWFFRSPIEWFTPMINGQAAAMLRTTITFTMASGSNACNVMPREASVGANMRFIHHQDMGESLAVIGKIAKKYDLEMEVMQGSPCSKMIDIHGDVYKYVADTVTKTFPGCISSPYVLTAATDATFYEKICDNCIRFAPIIYGPEEKKGIHGVNEALRYDCLPGAVDFYKNLIRDNH